MSEEDRLMRMTVNDVIRTSPRTIEVFNRFGIDACCGGASTLAEAGARDGADIASLVREVLRVVREAA
jgi:regulator of cell morphogenesis and NO signaling